MTTKLINLAKDDREALLAALRAPGWATSIEAIADGTDAIRRLRAAPPEAVSIDDPGEYVMEAIRAAMMHAISRGMFGPGPELLELCEKVGIEPGKRRSK